MLEPKEDLGVVVHAPALAGDDERPLAIVKALEQALPGLRMEWTTSEARQLRMLPHRDVWLVQSQRGGGVPLICNNDERYPVMLSGRGRSAASGPGGHAMLEVHAQLPLDARGIAAAEGLLEGIAEGAHAYWGHASAKSLGSELARQMRHVAHGPERSPRGLPMLELPARLGAASIPFHLGWVNYWSAAAARAIGFPDPSRDADLLSRARRTASGGWVVRLTDAPLDLDAPAHLEVLRRAYERFPAVGGRSAP